MKGLYRDLLGCMGLHRGIILGDIYIYIAPTMANHMEQTMEHGMQIVTIYRGLWEDFRKVAGCEQGRAFKYKRTRKTKFIEYMRLRVSLLDVRREWRAQKEHGSHCFRVQGLG